MITKKVFLQIFKKASLCRNFEKIVFEQIQKKNIKFPTYLSAGQEFIAATVSEMVSSLKIKPLIFGQHRAHSTYLSFGGNINRLIDELLGKKTGCAYGMGGSASIHGKEINMYGHDGHMGTQGPIGVGACFVSRHPTIVFLGDASAEEDYVLGALGWASTKKLPILFVVEDNNLSILTEKKVRRNWEMHAVAKSFNMLGYNISDDPKVIYKYKKNLFKKTMLLNIRTNRLFWHAGAGQDSDKTFDRYKSLLKKFGEEGKKIDKYYSNKLNGLWKKRLEKQ
jgi:TPP-dependent pyruvate/acetoin dehydrogenase alpha subunit